MVKVKIYVIFSFSKIFFFNKISVLSWYEFCYISIMLVYIFYLFIL